MSEYLCFDLAVSYTDFSLKAAADVPLTGITALSGPSGSGKTTLLRAIAGLESHASGHVRFAGEDWAGLPAAARGIGYVFQDARLFPHLDVAGNLAYGARRRGTGRARLDAVIEALDLGALLRRAPATLSGGETRRVALGRALASGPRILLMDEPLTGLDRARKSDLMPYIARAVAGFGVPAVYVTHSAGEIRFLADRTLSISEGRLIGWSPPPPRIVGQVIGTAHGQIQLSFGETKIWLSGQGDMGEVWAMPLGGDVIVSTKPPGLCNAALTLQAQVIRSVPGSGSIGVQIEGQPVELPWGRDDGKVPECGRPVWMSLPELAARPIQAGTDALDSA